jgi:hypothetical protein
MNANKPNQAASANQSRKRSYGNISKNNNQQYENHENTSDNALDAFYAAYHNKEGKSNEEVQAAEANFEKKVLLLLQQETHM